MIKVIKNIILCIRFPFLIPNDLSGKKKYKKIIKYTNLDRVPDGWRKAFGIRLCKELKKVIKEEKCKNIYFMDIKEKYGSLRFYTNIYNEKVEKILDKYDHISKYICIKCGKKATKISKGWISPFCDNCLKEEYFTYDSIDDFYEDKCKYNLDDYCIK